MDLPQCVDLNGGVENEASSGLLKKKRKCDICEKSEASYTCPKCNIAYCTLNCYRDPVKHLRCSESFYHDQVMSELKQIRIGSGADQAADYDIKNKMARILTKEAKCMEGEAFPTPLSDAIDDGEDDDDGDDGDEEAMISGADIKNIDEKDLVRAYETELSTWKPWWRHKEPILLEDHAPLPPRYNAKLLANASGVDVSRASEFMAHDLLQLAYIYVLVANIYQLNENDFDDPISNKSSASESVDNELLREVTSSVLQLDALVKTQRGGEAPRSTLAARLEYVVRTLLDDSTTHFLRDYIDQSFLVDSLADVLDLAAHTPKRLFAIFSKLYDMFALFVKRGDQESTRSAPTVANEQTINPFFHNRHLNQASKTDNTAHSNSQHCGRVQIIRNNASTNGGEQPKSQPIQVCTSREVRAFAKRIEFYFKWLSVHISSSSSSDMDLASQLEAVRHLKAKLAAECQTFAQDRQLVEKNLNALRSKVHAAATAAEAKSQTCDRKLIQEL